MTAPELWLGVACVVAALFAIAWWRARRRLSRRTRRRVRRAQTGESAAERILADAGYRVVERQPRLKGTFWIDDAPVAFDVRADLWVEAGPDAPWPTGARLIAEVKTGRNAPNPAYPPTRRQLREYVALYDPDGILLVDVEAGVIREVRFSAP